MSLDSSPIDPRGIDAVLLDFGGVFTDSPFEAVRAMGADMGAPIDDVLELVFGSYDEDNDHVWHRCERGELDLDTARRSITEAGREVGLEIDLFEMLKYMSSDGGPRLSVIERTRQLRADGYRTGLVTNNILEFREFWRPMIPLDELFDIVIDSSEVGVRKPDPRIYEIALGRAGWDRSQAQRVPRRLPGQCRGGAPGGHVRHPRRDRPGRRVGRAGSVAGRRRPRHSTLKHQARLVAMPGPSFTCQKVASAQF